MVGLYLIIVVIILIVDAGDELIDVINDMLNKDFSGSLLFVFGLIIAFLLSAIFSGD